MYRFSLICPFEEFYKNKKYIASPKWDIRINLWLSREKDMYLFIVIGNWQISSTPTKKYDYKAIYATNEISHDENKN